MCVSFVLNNVQQWALEMRTASASSLKQVSEMVTFIPE